MEVPKKRVSTRPAAAVAALAMGCAGTGHAHQEEGSDQQEVDGSANVAMVKLAILLPEGSEAHQYTLSHAGGGESINSTCEGRLMTSEVPQNQGEFALMLKDAKGKFTYLFFKNGLTDSVEITLKAQDLNQGGYSVQ